MLVRPRSSLRRALAPVTLTMSWVMALFTTTPTCMLSEYPLHTNNTDVCIAATSILSVFIAPAQGTVTLAAEATAVKMAVTLQRR